MSTQPKPRVLTGEEKESCLVWDEANKDVQVAVYSPRWIRHLEGKLGLKPDEVDDSTKDGCRFYTIPKSWLRLPQRPKRLSPGHRAKVVKALATARSRARQGVKTLSSDRATEAKSPTRDRGKTSVRPTQQSPVRRTPRPSKQGITPPQSKIPYAGPTKIGGGPTASVRTSQSIAWQPAS